MSIDEYIKDKNITYAKYKYMSNNWVGYYLFDLKIHTDQYTDIIKQTFNMDKFYSIIESSIEQIDLKTSDIRELNESMLVICLKSYPKTHTNEKDLYNENELSNEMIKAFKQSINADIDINDIKYEFFIRCARYENKEQLNTNQFIKLAYYHTLRLNKEYVIKMSKQRSAISGKSVGSTYDLSANDLRMYILASNWEETTHPNVAEGCRVFTTTDIPTGKNGIRNIEDFPDDTIFYAVDQKETGFVGIGVDAENANPYVEKTYLITGKEEVKGELKDVIYTFHPGEPLKLKGSQTTSKELPDGTKLTKQQVLDYGFHHCKLMDKELVKQYNK